MALGNVTIYDDAVAHPGSKRFNVHLGVAAGINAGELCIAIPGTKYVTRWGNSIATKPAVSNTAQTAFTTHVVAGLAATTSTDTTSANGVVDVIPNTMGLTYLVAPDTAASWDTQAEYDALIGARVLLSTSSTGVQTILASDGANNGLVVEPLDIAKYPGKVRFSIRSVVTKGF